MEGHKAEPGENVSSDFERCASYWLVIIERVLN